MSIVNETLKALEMVAAEKVAAKKAPAVSKIDEDLAAIKAAKNIFGGEVDIDYARRLLGKALRAFFKAQNSEDVATASKVIGAAAAVARVFNLGTLARYMTRRDADMMASSKDLQNGLKSVLKAGQRAPHAHLKDVVIGGTSDRAGWLAGALKASVAN